MTKKKVCIACGKHVENYRITYCSYECARPQMKPHKDGDYKVFKDHSMYVIGNDGNIFSLSKGKYMETLANKDNKNYDRLLWSSGGGQRICKTYHKIVWETFVGKIPKGMHINHKNGNKSDNRISNLEVVTPKENVRHAFRTGLVPVGERSYSSVLLEEEVKWILKNTGNYSLAEIAMRFGVSRSTVLDIKKGRTWKHVTRNSQATHGRCNSTG